MTDHDTRAMSADGRIVWTFSRDNGSLETLAPPYYGRGLLLTAIDVERLAMLLQGIKESVATHAQRLRDKQEIPPGTPEHLYTANSIDGRAAWTYDTYDGTMNWQLPHGANFYLDALDIEILAKFLECHKCAIIDHARRIRFTLQVTADDSPALTGDVVIYG